VGKVTAKKIGKLSMSAQMSDDDEADGLNSSDPIRRAAYQKAKEESDKILANMSKPGKLGLPPLLEERRLECGIIDEAFEKQALFDRVIVYQHDRHQGNTYINGGVIEQPDGWHDGRLQQSPRGIIISAGVQALDVMRTNGMLLGDYVWVAQNVLRKIPIGRDAGLKEIRVLLCRIGDIALDEDLYHRLKDGDVKLTWTGKEDPSKCHHNLEWKGDKPMEPMTPFIGADE